MIFRSVPPSLDANLALGASIAGTNLSIPYPKSMLDEYVPSSFYKSLFQTLMWNEKLCSGCNDTRFPTTSMATCALWRAPAGRYAHFGSAQRTTRKCYCCSILDKCASFLISLRDSQIVSLLTGRLFVSLSKYWQQYCATIPKSECYV